MTGASKFDVEGMADSIIVVGSGASNVDTDDVKAKYVKVNFSGASKAEVYASEEFVGEVSGASSISVSGNPQKRSNQTSGGSSVKFE